MSMIQIIIWLVIGIFIGYYAGSERFRSKVNGYVKDALTQKKTAKSRKKTS